MENRITLIKFEGKQKPNSQNKLLKLLIIFRHRELTDYPEEKIIEYVNLLSADVQKNVENSITDPKAQENLKLANLMSSIAENDKPQELPLVMKLKSESQKIPEALKTNNVNFA